MRKLQREKNIEQSLYISGLSVLRGREILFELRVFNKKKERNEIEEYKKGEKHKADSLCTRMIALQMGCL